MSSENTAVNGNHFTSNNAAPSSAQAQQQQQQQLRAEQLQLLQLSFGEHEFGLSDIELFPAQEDAYHHSSSSASTTAKSQQPSGDAVPDLPFDPFLFVDEKLDHGLDLGALHNDLGIFERFLQQKILQHVHDELHEAFVNVSGRLVGLEEPLQRVRAPLHSLTTKLESSLSTIAQAESRAFAIWKDAQALDLTQRFHIGLAQVRLLHHACCNEVDAVETFLFSCVEGVKDGQQSPTSPTKLPTNLFQSLRPELVHVLQEFPQRSTVDAQKQLISLLQRAVAALFDLRGAFEVLVVPNHHKVASNQTNASSSSTAAADESESSHEKALASYQELSGYVNEAVQYISQLLGGAFLGLHHVVAQVEENGGAEYVTLKKLFREIMQLYTILGPQEFAGIYRDGIVRPFVENILSWKMCNQVRGNTAAIAELISELIKAVHRSLLPSCQLIRDTFAADDSGHSSAGTAQVSNSQNPSLDTTSIKPISSIFWPPICSVVATRLVSLFTAGNPDVFHANFLSAHRLVALMERYCSSVEELRAFRMSTDTTLWTHAWNIDVYHTLRATAAADTVNKILSSTVLSESAPASEVVSWPQWVSAINSADHTAALTSSTTTITVQYPVTKQIMHAMLWYFSPEVFLYPLSAKLLREAVVTLQRYVLDMVQRLGTSGAAQTSAAASSAPVAFDASQARRVLCDLIAMQQFVDGLFRRVVEAVTAEVALTCQPLSAVFQIASSALCEAAGIQKVKLMLVVALDEQCFAQLQHLRTVKAAYSRTKKALPTEPSWFIADIVKPFDTFRKQCAAEGGLVSPSMAQELIQQSIEHVALRFKEITKETLVSARKTEESLEKLRRKREEAAGGGNGTNGSAGVSGTSAGSVGVKITEQTASDRDKMVVQLFLDAQRFAQLLTAFGIVTEGFSPVQAILQLCRRGRWIVSGCVGPEPTEVEEDE